MSKNPNSSSKLNEEYTFEVSNYDKRNRRFVRIDVSDLKLCLINFKESIIQSHVVTPLVAIMALWIPYITADIKPLLGMSAEQTKGLYLGLAIAITLYFLWQWLKYTLRKFKQSEGALTDADELAETLYKKGLNDT